MAFDPPRADRAQRFGGFRGRDGNVVDRTVPSARAPSSFTTSRAEQHSIDVGQIADDLPDRLGQPSHERGDGEDVVGALAR